MKALQSKSKIIFVLFLVIFSLCVTLSASPQSKAELPESKDQTEFFTNALSEQLNEPLVPMSVTIVNAGKLNEQKGQNNSKMEEVIYWVIRCSFKASSNGKTYDKYYMVLFSSVYAGFDHKGGAGAALQVIELPSFLHELM